MRKGVVLKVTITIITAVVVALCSAFIDKLVDEIVNGGKEPIHEHTLISHEAKARTCEEAGWEAYRTCSTCTYSEKVELPALGHSIAEDGEVITSATCTEKGSMKCKCTRTGCNTHYELKEISPLGHEMSDWNTVTAETCTTTGKETHKCTRTGCVFSEDRVIPAAHVTVSHDGQAATCTEDGWSDYETCSRCDNLNTKTVITKLDHSLSNWGENTATCESGGSETRRCNRDGCLYSESRDTEPLGHDYVAHRAQAATCTSNGWNEHKTCSRCDYNTKVTIPRLGHIFNSNSDTCENCYAKYSVGLDFSENTDTCYVSGIGDCTDTDIIIPPTDANGNTVIGIYTHAFYNSNIKSIYIPSTVRYIDSLPNNLESIAVAEDNEYFKDIDGNLYTKDGKTLIVYAGAKKDTSFTVPEDVEIIANGAFSNSENLKNITLSSSIVSIEYGAFSGCSKLESIEIPASVTSIGDSAFDGCTGLKSIKVAQGNEYYRI